MNSWLFVFVFGPISRWYFDPSSQKCDKVLEVGLWLPIAQVCKCNNVDPLWCLLRQFTSRGKISTKWKFIWEFQDLTVFFTPLPAQYELLLDSGMFWDTLILRSQTKFASSSNLWMVLVGAGQAYTKIGHEAPFQNDTARLRCWVLVWDSSFRVLRYSTVLNGVMSWSRVGALFELCSPFLKGGNSAFIAVIASSLISKIEYRSLKQLWPEWPK